MKKSLLFIVPLFALGWFFSCSIDFGAMQRDGDQLFEQEVIRVVEKSSKLPVCDEQTANQLFYLTQEQEFRYCNGVAYLPVALQGMDGAKGEKGDPGTDGNPGDKGDTGEKGADGSSCISSELPDGSGVEIRCDDGTVHIIKHGIDGTSCTGREVPEGIEISCGGQVVGIIRHGDQGNGESSSSSSGGASSSSSQTAQDFGTLTDTRDDKTYKWIKIGNQIWMAENLNFGTRVAGTAYQNDATAESAQKYCYNDNELSCNTFGGLYQWHSVMAFIRSCNSSSGCTVNSPHRGICPEGWHVPTSEEWSVLEEWVDFDNDGEENRNEGASLKSISLWNNDGNGTDAYDWTGLPGGSRDGLIFSGYGYGNWWSASAYDAERVWYRYLYADYDYLDEYRGYKSDNGFSVRCVQD